MDFGFLRACWIRAGKICAVRENSLQLKLLRKEFVLSKTQVHLLLCWSRSHISFKDYSRIKIRSWRAIRGSKIHSWPNHNQKTQIFDLLTSLWRMTFGHALIAGPKGPAHSLSKIRLCLWLWQSLVSRSCFSARIQDSDSAARFLILVAFGLYELLISP